MEDADFRNNVLARCSQEWHYRKVSRPHFIDRLAAAIFVLNQLDEIKKALFYGCGEQEALEPIYGGTDYKTRNFVHAILGLATEAGELLEALHKMLTTGEPMDEVNLQEEFGDANWYRTLGLIMLSQTHEQNIVQNDAKLERRFGPVFSADRANNRDLDGERQTLEG